MMLRKHLREGYSTGRYKMSADAADLFDISHDELGKFLSYDEDGDAGKQVVDDAVTQYCIYKLEPILIAICVVAALALLVVFILICLLTKRRWKKGGKDGEKADLACDESSLPHVTKQIPLLSQIYDKAPSIARAKHQSQVKSELRKLCVKRIDITAGFNSDRNRLRVKVRRITFNNFNETLRESICTKFMVAMELANSSVPSYFESKLRPLAGENYFEEPCEFEMSLEDISSTKLKASVYATDRYSQHRLVNKYSYEMACDVDADAIPESLVGLVLPVTLTEVSPSDDNNKIAEESIVGGELSFSLCYMPTSGRLTFVALTGRNICNHLESPIGTYLRVSLLVSGKMVKTVETSSVKKSPNPVYNEVFVFHTPLERIKYADIVVSVMFVDGETTASEPNMEGKVSVGPAATTDLGRQHWIEMLSVARRPVAQWHGIGECVQE